jgi:hypothetical protein
MSEPSTGQGADAETDDFERALRELHALIGINLDVDLWFRDHFFAVGLTARLLRIETLPDTQSVIIYFDNGVKIDLAPNEQVPTKEEDRLSFAVGEEMVLELSPAAVETV